MLLPRIPEIAIYGLNLPTQYIDAPHTDQKVVPKKVRANEPLRQPRKKARTKANYDATEGRAR